jgi:predicted transposase/invertase (TIGR01784 family)
VLDVLAQDAEGRRYNIEMQVRRYGAWSARSAYYLARTLTQQLNGGDDYQSLKSAIGIHLLDFELFTDPEYQQQAVWCFELRDRTQPALKLGDELQLNLIELPKADRLGAGNPALAAWVAFLEHWHEEHTMAQIDYPPVQQALENIKALSADEEIRRLAFVRERALRDERSEIRAAIEKGKLEGKLEGEAAILERQLTKRFGPLDETCRARLHSATVEQLECWADRILDAKTVDVVFAEQSE